jgi:hypothetical protein
MLRHWTIVELDLHEVYGIDLGGRDLLRRRSWMWLVRRAAALVSTPSLAGTRTQRALRPDDFKVPKSKRAPTQ